jgi:hypothetical protein
LREVRTDFDRFESQIGVVAGLVPTTLNAGRKQE